MSTCKTFSTLLLQGVILVAPALSQRMFRKNALLSAKQSFTEASEVKLYVYKTTVG